MSEDSAMSTVTASIWDILGIEQTADERSIKRAYAKQLKVNRPEDDAAAFQLLREAYEHALRIAEFLRTQAAQVDAAPPVAADAAPQMEPAPAINLEKQRDSTFQIAQLAMPAAVAPPLTVAPEPEPTAAELWAGLLAFEEGKRLWELKTISSGDALLNFEVRHEFETLALRYCAGPECSDEMREALIEHFDWKNDGQHMRSLDNWAAHIVVARCRAAWSLEMFSNELANRPLLKLLQDRTAPELAGRLKDATFTRHLLRLITVVRAHHPEMLAYKLEPGVVEWWYQRANAKRYFVDTAKQSFFAGLGLFALYFALCTWLLPQREPYLDFAALVLGQAVAFGVGALLAFRFPDLIPGLKASTAHHTATLLALRYRSAVQFGWLPPLLLLFLLVFTESPTPLLASCVRVGMALAMAAALFAMSPGLTLAGAGLVVLVGAFFAALMVSALFSGFGLPAFICGGIALAVQYLRGGESLYAFSGLPLSHLTRLRLAWLAGAAGVIYFALTAFLLERQLAAIVFTWAFFGILLSRPRFALWNFPVLVILSIGLDLMERAGTYKIGDARLRLMLLMLEYVAFTMLLNMWRARTTKQYFS